MKTPILIMISLAFSLQVFAQDDACMQGDCKNEYGSYYNEQTSVVYHGFYKDGIYNGVGYHQNSKGHYYLSQFKNGMPNGHTIYDEGENRTSGFFKDGLKNGLHVRAVSNEPTYAREVLNYANGVLVNKTTYSTSVDTPGPCLAGKCDNGFGILKTQGMMLFGSFENNRMVSGEFMQTPSKVSEFFVMPTQDSMGTPYFKVSLYPQQGSIQEVAATYIGRKLDGEYIVVDATTGQTGGAIFKDDQVLKKY